MKVELLVTDEMSGSWAGTKFGCSKFNRSTATLSWVSTLIALIWLTIDPVDMIEGVCEDCWHLSSDEADVDVPGLENW